MLVPVYRMRRGISIFRERKGPIVNIFDKIRKVMPGNKRDNRNAG
jgi:hypothetical protein